MCTASPVARSEYDPGASGPFMSRTNGTTRCVSWKWVRSIRAECFTMSRSALAFGSDMASCDNKRPTESEDDYGYWRAFGYLQRESRSLPRFPARHPEAHTRHLGPRVAYLWLASTRSRPS